MPFSVQLTQTYRRIEADTFGAGGRIAALATATVQVTGATRHQEAVRTLSAGVSNLALGLDPIAASQPGSLLLVQADQPLDLRLNASTATLICGVLLWLFAASAVISALFVTNPQTVDATVRTAVIGGGALQASIPLP
jgi:hypothetical protein